MLDVRQGRLVAAPALAPPPRPAPRPPRVGTRQGRLVAGPPARRTYTPAEFAALAEAWRAGPEPFGALCARLGAGPPEAERALARRGTPAPGWRACLVSADRAARRLDVPVDFLDGFVERGWLLQPAAFAETEWFDQRALGAFAQAHWEWLGPRERALDPATRRLRLFAPRAARLLGLSLEALAALNPRLRPRVGPFGPVYHRATVAAYLRRAGAGRGPR